MPIDLYFKPNSDKEVNFNLICNVRRKTLPVTLNVKAEGYSMDSTLLCEDSTGNRVELTPNGLNQINFGEVQKGLKSILVSTQIVSIHLTMYTVYQFKKNGQLKLKKYNFNAQELFKKRRFLFIADRMLNCLIILLYQ